jgi:hypothetical protein
MTIGWMTTKKIEVMPSGAIIRPNNNTNQGIVRQRVREPMGVVGSRARKFLQLDVEMIEPSIVNPTPIVLFAGQ